MADPGQKDIPPFGTLPFLAQPSPPPVPLPCLPPWLPQPWNVPILPLGVHPWSWNTLCLPPFAATPGQGLPFCPQGPVVPWAGPTWVPQGLFPVPALLPGQTQGSLLDEQGQVVFSPGQRHESQSPDTPQPNISAVPTCATEHKVDPPTNNDDKCPAAVVARHAPFVCRWESCGRVLSSVDRLQRHEATHVNVKAFRCLIGGTCTSTFTRRSSVKIHITKVHKLDPHEPWVQELLQESLGLPRRQKASEKRRVSWEDERTHSPEPRQKRTLIPD